MVMIWSSIKPSLFLFVTSSPLWGGRESHSMVSSGHTYLDLYDLELRENKNFFELLTRRAAGPVPSTPPWSAGGAASQQIDVTD